MEHAFHHQHVETPAGGGRLIFAVVINLVLTGAQVVGGVISGSLSLVADALHNLNDAAALMLALIARRIARRPFKDSISSSCRQGGPASRPSL